MAIQVGWGQQWETLANAIHDYYGGGVGYPQYEKVVQMLNSGEYTMEEMDAIIGQIPNFNRTYNAAGQLTSVSYNVSTNATTSAAGSVAQQVNSNVANSTQTQFSTVQTVSKDSVTEKVTISDSVKKYNNGVAGTTKAIATSALQGIFAASVGIKIGKVINQAAYNVGFNWLAWAGVDMESLNPETWGSITAGEDSTGAKLFNFVFDIDPQTGNPQAYIDENAFAYMVAYMMATGVFGEDHGVQPPSDIEDLRPSGNTWVLTNPLICTNNAVSTTSDTWNMRYVPDSDVWICFTNISETGYTLVGCTKEPNKTIAWYNSPQASPAYVYLNNTVDFNGQTIYYAINKSQGQTNQTTSLGNILSDGSFSGSTADDNLAWLMYAILFGTPLAGVEGITDQAGEPQFDTTGLNDPTNIAAILAALMTQFPELWDNRIEVSPDGDNVIKYIPVGFPTGGVGQEPTTNGATASDLTPDISGDGDNATDELIKTLIDLIQNPQTSGGMESDTTTPTQPVDPNGDPRGTGETPAIVLPTGSASALWKIYNPSQAQLDTFGAWLWSSNFVDQLLKVFNDPMQAIIGLHKIYATPPTSGSGAIKVGYLVSDASANYVSAQYTEIDCGTVNLKEHFNNVFDYDPFTKVSIFLPFIGFRQLNISDIMRGDISVKYGIDVLTGACLAKISVTRDLNENVLYTFSGNCAVQYPVSSGSYVGILTGLLGIAGGIAGTIASGGALAPMLMGAGASVGAMHTNIEHSGNIGSNAGAMGIKKPYIVIERPQTKIPLYGVDIEGKPQNETVILGTCSGHVRVKAAEFNGFSCTAGELTKIKQLLSSGIII